MNKVKGLLLDLDGTLYRGNSPIQEAGGFIQKLRNDQVPFLFVTNNSTLPPELVADKLTRLGVKAYPHEVITSSIGTVQYIEGENPEAIVYAIGEAGLLQAFRQTDLRVYVHDSERQIPEEVDYVAVGLDRKFHYEQMKAAVKLLIGGARLIGTNPDLRLPTEDGFWPGSGSICAAIGMAAGVEPVYIGKPEPHLLEMAAEQLGLDAAEVLVVGDNLETDIAGAEMLKYMSALVLTGYSTRQDAADSRWKPTWIAENLVELYRQIRPFF